MFQDVFLTETDAN